MSRKFNENKDSSTEFARLFNGVKYENNEDFAALFEESENEEQGGKQTGKAAKPEKKAAELNEFTKLFADRTEKKPHDPDEFAKLLDEYSDIDFEIHKREKELDAKGQKDLFRPWVGSIMPQREIDLHGLTQEDAENIVQNAVRTMKKEGVSRLRIVTGKGLHSQFAPVLPNAIDDLLLKLKKEGLFSRIEWEKGEIRNSGYVDVIK